MRGSPAATCPWKPTTARSTAHRTLIAGDNFYTITMTGRKDKATGKDAVRFEESFKLVKWTTLMSEPKRQQAGLPRWRSGSDINAIHPSENTFEPHDAAHDQPDTQRTIQGRGDLNNITPATNAPPSRCRSRRRRPCQIGIKALGDVQKSTAERHADNRPRSGHGPRVTSPSRT